MPAWCDAAGTPVEAFPGADDQLPNRLSAAAVSARAKTSRTIATRAPSVTLRKLSDFFATLGADQIGDGYELGHSRPRPAHPQPNAGSAVFVGCAAAGAQHDARYQPFLDAAYARVRTGKLLARSRYYNHCWTVLSLLMLTGNLVEFPE